MKNRIKILTVTAAIIAGLSVNAAFAGGIACVDVQKVVSASSQVQALKKEQQKKKSILARMAQQGLVRVSRGRGGSQLTPEGRRLYETGQLASINNQ